MCHLRHLRLKIDEVFVADFFSKLGFQCASFQVYPTSIFVGCLEFDGERITLDDFDILLNPSHGGYANLGGLGTRRKPFTPTDLAGVNCCG